LAAPIIPAAVQHIAIAAVRQRFTLLLTHHPHHVLDPVGAGERAPATSAGLIAVSAPALKWHSFWLHHIFQLHEAINDRFRALGSPWIRIVGIAIDTAHRQYRHKSGAI
jgi:hypothetical protein